MATPTPPPIIPPAPSKEAQDAAFAARGNPSERTAPGSAPGEERAERVRDAHGRLVSNKKANQAFLSYGRWKAAEQKKALLASERRARRQAKSAAGEPLAPEDLDEPEDSAAWALFKVFVVCLAFVAIAGRFVVGSFTWGYEGKWVRWRTYWPQSERTFTETELAKYDGTTPDLPIYLGMDGLVFDVSASRRIYGPGGSYSNFAGVDAARAYATGCFALHRTHDKRGLSEAELNAIEHWKQFFTNSEKYFKVGKVLHPPIDPGAPIPPPCDAQGNAVPQDLPGLQKDREKHGGEL